MDFESVADELFAGAREEFTTLRDQRAREARPDAELAKKIGRLRKPTVAAWLVNQVSRTHPEEINRLARLGEDLRQAHQNLAGAELRALSKKRHELIDVLNQRARWLARKAGHPFGDAAARQIEDTFEAMVSSPDAAEAVRGARLSTALSPGSAEDWLTAGTVPIQKPVPTQKPGPRRKPAVPAPEKPATHTTRTRATEKRELEKARREAKEAARERDRARQALAKAEREAEKAAAALADLRTRLAEAVELARDKRAQAAGARKAVKAAERAVSAAEKRLERR